MFAMLLYLTDDFLRAGTAVCPEAVSYTHLDVYKRQKLYFALLRIRMEISIRLFCSLHSWRELVKSSKQEVCKPLLQWHMERKAVSYTHLVTKTLCLHPASVGWNICNGLPFFRQLSDTVCIMSVSYTHLGEVESLCLRTEPLDIYQLRWIQSGSKCPSEQFTFAGWRLRNISAGENFLVWIKYNTLVILKKYTVYENI